MSPYCPFCDSSRTNAFDWYSHILTHDINSSVIRTEANESVRSQASTCYLSSVTPLEFLWELIEVREGQFPWIGLVRYCEIDYWIWLCWRWRDEVAVEGCGRNRRMDGWFDQHREEKQSSQLSLFIVILTTSVLTGEWICRFLLSKHVELEDSIF